MEQILVQGPQDLTNADDDDGKNCAIRGCNGAMF